MSINKNSAKIQIEDRKNTLKRKAERGEEIDENINKYIILDNKQFEALDEQQITSNQNDKNQIKTEEKDQNYKLKSLIDLEEHKIEFDQQLRREQIKLDQVKTKRKEFINDYKNYKKEFEDQQNLSNQQQYLVKQLDQNVIQYQNRVQQIDNKIQLLQNQPDYLQQQHNSQQPYISPSPMLSPVQSPSSIPQQPNPIINLQMNPILPPPQIIAQQPNIVVAQQPTTNVQTTNIQPTNANTTGYGLEQHIALYKAFEEKYSPEKITNYQKIYNRLNINWSGTFAIIEQTEDKVDFSMSFLKQYYKLDTLEQYEKLVFIDLMKGLLEFIKLTVSEGTAAKTFTKDLPFTSKNTQNKKITYLHERDFLKVINYGIYMELIKQKGHQLLYKLTLGSLMSVFCKLFQTEFSSKNYVKEGIELFQKSKVKGQLMWIRDLELKSILLFTLICTDMKDLYNQVVQAASLKFEKRQPPVSLDSQINLFKNFNQQFNPEGKPFKDLDTKNNQFCKICDKKTDLKSKLVCKYHDFDFNEIENILKLQQIAHISNRSNVDLIYFLEIFQKAKKSLFNTIIWIFFVPFCERYFRNYDGDCQNQKKEHELIKKLILKIGNSDIFETQVQDDHNQLDGNDQGLYQIHKPIVMSRFYNQFAEYKDNWTEEKMKKYFYDTQNAFQCCTQNRVLWDLIIAEFVSQEED